MSSVAAAPIYIVTIVFDDGSASGYEGCNTHDFDVTSTFVGDLLCYVSALFGDR